MKAKVILSAFTSFLFGLITFFVLNLLNIDNVLVLSVIAGLITYLLLFPYLILHEKMMNKKYAEIEKKITSPIFYKTNTNFDLGRGEIKNGNLYFCEDGIVCVCVETKPYVFQQIPLHNIERYQFDDIHLNIFVSDGRVLVATACNVREIIEVLREKQWI